MANQGMLLEYKKFWFDETSRQIQGKDAKRYQVADDEETLHNLRKLASYVPKLVVRRMYQNPDPVSPPEIEKYQACVVFADISGFTPLTEKMASMGLEGVERLTRELNKYFDHMISNIYRHGGDIVKVRWLDNDLCTN
jgi:class 3 adenylate cyclase